MNTVQSITVVEDVTLISLHDSPADIDLIAKIFAIFPTFLLPLQAKIWAVYWKFPLIFGN